MSLLEPQFDWNGRRYTAADMVFSQNAEICHDDCVTSLPIISSNVDASLCAEVNVYGTSDGDFFIVWEQWHPERVSISEFREAFPDGMTAEESRWFEDSKCDLPSTQRVEKITRREAYELLIRTSSLPDVFYSDAGL